MNEPLTFEWLKSLRFSPNEKCHRCGSALSLDWGITEEYGHLPYAECSICRDKGIYPWGHFYVLPPQYREALSHPDQ